MFFSTGFDSFLVESVDREANVKDETHFQLGVVAAQCVTAVFALLHFCLCDEQLFTHDLTSPLSSLSLGLSRTREHEPLFPFCSLRRLGFPGRSLCSVRHFSSFHSSVHPAVANTWDKEVVPSWPLVLSASPFARSIVSTASEPFSPCRSIVATLGIARTLCFFHFDGI